MNEPTTDEHAERHARFARNGAGLANVAAGGLALAAYFLATMLDAAGAWARVALAAAPVAWFGVKEMLRRRYVNRHRAPEVTPRGFERQWRVLFTGLTALIGAMVVLVGAVSRTDPSFPEGRMLPMWLYVVFAVGTSLLVWRLNRTLEEMLVAVFLIVQASIYLVGSDFALGSGIQTPIVAVLAILLGTKQHTEFRAMLSAQKA